MKSAVLLVKITAHGLNKEMKVFIATFGQQNYEWPQCQAHDRDDERPRSAGFLGGARPRSLRRLLPEEREDPQGSGANPTSCVPMVQPHVHQRGDGRRSLDFTVRRINFWWTTSKARSDLRAPSRARRRQERGGHLPQTPANSSLQKGPSNSWTRTTRFMLRR